MISPEKSMEIQNALGADIIMAFDECAPYPADRRYVKDSLQRTTRWLKQLQGLSSGLGAAVTVRHHAGRLLRICKESAAAIVDLDLPGYSIGGLSVRRTKGTVSRYAG